MVSDQTLTTDVWTSMRSLLVAAALQTTEGTSIKSASIGASYNDESPNKPQVIIEPVPYDEGDWKFGSNEGKKFINVTIGIYSDKNIAIDQLFDQTMYIIKNNTIDGIELIGLTSDVAFNTSASSKVKNKTIVASYDRE